MTQKTGGSKIVYVCVEQMDVPTADTWQKGGDDSCFGAVDGET